MPKETNQIKRQMGATNSDICLSSYTRKHDTSVMPHSDNIGKNKVKVILMITTGRMNCYTRDITRMVEN